MSDCSDPRLPKNVKKRLILKKKKERKRDRLQLKQFVLNEMIILNELENDYLATYNPVISSFELIDFTN